MSLRSDRRPGLAVLLPLGIALGCATPDVTEVPGPGFSPGKGGPNVSTPLVVTFADAEDHAVVSDGRAMAGVAGSAYVDGVCGVAAVLHENREAFNTLLNPDEARIRPKDAGACGGTAPRYLELRFPDGVVFQTTATTFFEQLNTVMVGATEQRNAKINNDRCSALEFNPAAGGDAVLVTRESATAWAVRTQDAPNDRAFCRTDGTLYRMPFAATVEVK